MTAQEAIAYIHSIPRFPKVPGLSRMDALLKRMGNPQASLKFIHIAGTNGKGSVAAMTASVLTAAGYRTGLFTSPYLETFRERITIDGNLISESSLISCVMQVQKTQQDMEAAGEESPVEFEVVTAVGFLHFLAERCDFVVLETGLGGRFDATNVIAPPQVAGITSISLDHTKILGDTLSAIAYEKSGILKKGSVAVIAPGQAPETMDVIEAHCKKLGIEMICPDPIREESISLTRLGTEFTFLGRRYQIPLLGRHQVDNAVTALEMIRVLQARGHQIDQGAVETGLSRVSWKGRLELLSRQPDILLDTAHNRAGIEALGIALDHYFPGKEILTVMGMLSDKAYLDCVRAIASRSAFFCAVMPPDTNRGISAEKCADAARPYCNEVWEGESVSHACRQMLTKMTGNTLLLVCGSIPLVGEARKILRAAVIMET